MATRVDAVEPALAAIWAGVLDVEHVAPEDDFFELGGTSLLAMQIVARAADAFGVELALDALFEAPTVAGLAQAIGVAERAAAPRRARRRGRREAPSLSRLQASAWAAQAYVPTARPHVGDAYRLEGPLDVDALERALTELVRRHEVLRTAFPLAGERPVPRVLAPEPVRVPIATLGRGARQRADAELDALVHAAREEPFDYAAQPPLRVQLIRRGPHSHVLVLLTHEIVCDGWGFDALVRELSLLYGAFVAGRPSPLEEPAPQYADVVRERAQRAANGGDPDRWRRALAPAPLTLPLPVDVGGRPVHGGEPAQLTGRVPGAVSTGLRTLGAAEAATSFMVHLAAFYVLLHGHTGEPSLLVTSPAANRVRTELEGVIGFFARVLPLCVALDGDPSFRTLLQRTREATLRAFAHADELPEDNRIRELSGLRGLLGGGAVFRLWDPTLERRLELAGVRSQPYGEGGEGSVVGLIVREQPGRETSVELSTSVLGRAAAEAMLGQYQRVLEQVATDPDRSLGAIELLGEGERRQALGGGSRGGAGADDARCLHELVEAQARSAPDAPALRWGADGREQDGEQLSYAQLDAEAERLARHLRGRGVGPEARVGLALEPSLELVVAALAVLRAGAACVPLGALATLPALDVLVTNRARAPPTATARVIDLAAEREAIAAAGAGAAAPAAERPPRADDVAFVLPSAGVTGPPKAVELTHRALVHAAVWRQHAYRLTPADRVLHAPGPGVLAWALSPWAALACGACVVIPERVPDAPGPRVVHWLEARQATVAGLPPVLAASCLTSPDAERTPLRTLLVQGRGPLPPASAARQTRLVAFREYAVAEAGGLVFSARVRGGADALVSDSPTATSAPAYVLDERLRPLPAGACGELYLGGPAIARGYAGDPERTARAFVADPFATTPGAQLVRTGDLARRRADGTLELLGRVADEVRFRGFRLGPCMEELEATLAAHPGIAAAATDWDAAASVLTAYVVPRRGAPLEAAELDRWVQERTVDWVLPARYATIEKLPLRPDGSPDRVALARVGGEPFGPDPARTSPRTRTEKKLQAIWRKVLGRRQIGVNDSFFALGGELIDGIEAIERARGAGIAIGAEDLLLRPTIAELAAIADRGHG